MGNFVDNELTIEGLQDDINRLKEQAKGPNGWLDMGMLFPFPDELRENRELAEKTFHPEIWDEIKHFENSTKMMQYITQYRNPIWLACTTIEDAWINANWGTSPDFDDFEFLEKDESIFYRFASNGSPPKSFIKQLGKLYPELMIEFRYFESSLEVNGILCIEYGVITREQSSDYFGHRGG